MNSLDPQPGGIGTQLDTWITMSDGNRLAATLYLPRSAEPVPVLLEALPYRKDDLTSSYRPEYVRFRDEHAFGVVRLDLRGTGSSSGIATDEYPEQEQLDLVEVIEWLASQPWCNGSVGMFGTSWSGFNSIQVAMRRPPALKAICASYATDDRWSDDVHYYGGALRLLDQVDYPLYMVAMNGLPPVPAVYGPDWREEWLRRLQQTPPWMLKWLREQRRDPYWRHGSLRPGYDQIQAATMLIVGWADGYRNNSLRTARALHAAGRKVHVLAGPWTHQAPLTAYPGPNVDHVPLMADWFNTWLRPTVATAHTFGATDPQLTLFIREWSEPSADAAEWNGNWSCESVESLDSRTVERLIPLGVGTMSPAQHSSEGAAGWEQVSHDPDLGLAAWNSCAASLPWGLPTDQRRDDGRALSVDVTLREDLTIVGQPRLLLRLLPSQPTTHVAVRLCAVDPLSGTSVLITRGFLALSYRDGTAGEADLVPTPVEPNMPIDVIVELETVAYKFKAGEVLRVSLAATEWPNAVAAPGPNSYAVRLDASELVVPELVGLSPFAAPSFTTPIAAEPNAQADQDSESSHVKWWTEDDVLERVTSASVLHGGKYRTPYGDLCKEEYSGRVSIDRRTWEQHLSAATSFEIKWPELHVCASSDLEISVTNEAFDVRLSLRVIEVDHKSAEHTVHERFWQEVIPRDLA